MQNWWIIAITAKHYQWYCSLITDTWRVYWLRQIIYHHGHCSNMASIEHRPCVPGTAYELRVWRMAICYSKILKLLICSIYNTITIVTQAKMKYLFRRRVNMVRYETGIIILIACVLLSGDNSWITDNSLRRVMADHDRLIFGHGFFWENLLWIVHTAKNPSSKHEAVSYHMLLMC